MTEIEWLTCNDPTPMLRFVGGRLGERKERLFTLGCVRAFWAVLPHDAFRRAIEASEQHADGLIGVRELGAAITEANRHRRKGNALARAAYDAARTTPGRPRLHTEGVIADLARAAARREVPDPPPTAMTYFEGDKMVHVEFPITPNRARWNATRDEEHARQCRVLRDIAGDPFRPAPLDAPRLPPPALALARAIYDDHAFDRTLELADVLAAGGPTDPATLNHLRSDAPHVRGCWALDLLLGFGCLKLKHR